MRFGPKLTRTAAFLALGFAAGSASAQNGRANSNVAQAQLHIQVYVVPTVFSLTAPAQKAASVTYNVPSFVTQQSTSVQTSILDLNDRRLCEKQQPCRATLVTTTVVAR